MFAVGHFPGRVSRDYLRRAYPAILLLHAISRRGSRDIPCDIAASTFSVGVLETFMCITVHDRVRNTWSHYAVATKFQASEIINSDRNEDPQCVPPLFAGLDREILSYREHV